MSRILYARNENWGKSNPVYDWQSRIYSLTDSGNLRIKIFYDRIVSDSTARMSDRDFSEIKTIMEYITENPPQEEVDAEDGDAWYIAFYDRDSHKAIYKRKLGYTYGIESLEKIQEILRNNDEHM